ncbi:carbon-nitrogen hydrolase family protein [Amycolatopsis acidiphila]|uniref:Carbon-nitrogen hydrolase family protein n=1 Tax=Amycolatopsis acidiphila TaxID=715473 RepID=A0A558A1W2_9PSEU|nr:carbon-nitrogen hydrolase family protein [Amycolatopsis acidiphila]TVT18236.1 carbon-nitrogen hydrolase family protein [Amycolatopsis acidiphila]UIJ58423.1 carbon-nitrogen hydrolase family protein [Amycolatopsis acidiphila]GHG93361.1 apolipoprotein acyltransferase [Amycolatopsis acidiphila]
MLRIGLSQVTSSEDPAENLELIRAEVARAAAEGARVVVFPEAAMVRFGVSLKPLAEPVDGPWAKSVAAIAAEHDVLVVAGMFTPSDDGRVRNTLLITGLGQHLGYHKIHLYDAFGFRESDTVAPGADVVTTTVDDVTLGFATCYDIRFPELFRRLADMGASAIVVPTSWGAGEGKREQWDVLVRARALDSGCWVLGCGQADPAATGTPVNPKAPTGIGYSTVSDGFGRVHAQLGAGPELVVVDVDPQVTEKARAATGALANRRL